MINESGRMQHAYRRIDDAIYSDRKTGPLARALFRPARERLVATSVVDRVGMVAGIFGCDDWGILRLNDDSVQILHISRCVDLAGSIYVESGVVASSIRNGRIVMVIDWVNNSKVAKRLGFRPDGSLVIVPMVHIGLPDQGAFFVIESSLVSGIRPDAVSEFWGPESERAASEIRRAADLVRVPVGQEERESPGGLSRSLAVR
jgi:hypothetical protein